MSEDAVAKRENEIKSAFFKRFEVLYPVRLYTVLQHQDVRKPGHPDSSVHGFGKSSFWEFKHATPNFSTYALQEITCARLQKHTYCRYVLFFEYRDTLKILIAKPSDVRRRQGKIDEVKIEVEFGEHDFDTLAHFIHNVHQPRVELR